MPNAMPISMVIMGTVCMYIQFRSTCVVYLFHASCFKIGLHSLCIIIIIIIIVHVCSQSCGIKVDESLRNVEVQ